MSVAEELAKLEELRKQGALTQTEFDQQKKTLLKGGKKKRMPWLVRIPIALIGALVLYVSISNIADSNTVPACDSSSASAALKTRSRRTRRQTPTPISCWIS